MSSVFILIDEIMPINGTYPSSSVVAVYRTEAHAWLALEAKAHNYEYQIDTGDTVFFAPEGTFDPEKYEYIEYRIEEHVIETGENA